MPKKCPFRKRKMVINYNLHGVGGFPMANTTEEEFAECIGEKCMAYKTKTEKIPATGGMEHTVHYCYLCGKDPD